MKRMSDLRGRLRGLLCLMWVVAPVAGEVDRSVRPTQVVSVELLDASGRPAGLLSPGQLRVVEPPSGLRIVDVSPVSEWHVTVVFDRLFSESRTIRDAASVLSELAEDLVALGPVEIYTFDQDVGRAMVPSRDPDDLRQALAWIRIRESGKASQLEFRRRFISDFGVEELAETPYVSVSATAERRLSELHFGVKQALQAETRLIEAHRSGLLEWASENRRSGPSLLLFVTDGDDDSFAFYETLLEQAGVGQVLEGLTEPSPGPSREEVGRVLSSLGWVTTAFAPGVGGESVESTGLSSPEERVETIVQDGKVVDRTVFTPRFDPRDLLRRSRTGEEGESPIAPRLLAPLTTLVTLAEESGGDVAIDRQGLAQVLARLGGRHLLRLADTTGATEPIAVRLGYAEGSGGGLAPPRSRRWVSSVTPETVSEIRAWRLLDEGVEEGPLLVTSQVRNLEGPDRVLVEVEPVDDPDAVLEDVPLRVTLATLADGESPQFVHSVLRSGTDAEISDQGVVAMSLELSFEPVPGEPVVVMVEDLSSGRWGGSYATMLSGVDDLQSTLAETPRVVTLLEPESAMVVGSTLFETVCDRDVVRVEFYLDGQIAGERVEPPYALRLDMGRLPEPHRIEVVAFDDEDREIGRDRLTVNESGGVFRVSIMRPARDAWEDEPLVGPVIVEALIESPRTVPVSRVEFFWNEDLVATRYAGPFSQRVPVPPDDPRGFFRVVAHLEDGATAEDVLFINSPGGSERVRVDLVQLYAVVTDRNGRPVRGLEEESFRVLENGVDQEIATFSEAQDQPLTVGLAVDTSASMFVKLPRVQKAAGRFIKGLDAVKDRVFLVDFGSNPRLYHDTSKNLETVESALYDLEPSGQTAIWKGISFSLVQLQGIQGKKALIVFSDGADEDPDFSYRTCLKFARRVGVPIYVIVSNDEIYRTGGRGLNVRGFINRLESLTRAVGGRVFFSRVGEDLEEIYDQIDEELRSQYVLGYYASDEGDGRWKSIRIEVDEPGVRARTVAGYFR
jgi:Ca-activated chloride channel family protein